MPSIPKLCVHKPTGQYYVALNGQQIYLGTSKPVAQLRYDELIAKWISNGRQLPEQRDDVAVADLVIKYVKHSKSYYTKNGKQTNEFTQIKAALRPLNQLYGTLAAIEFGPKKLDIVRSAMIELDWSRKHINKQVLRIRRMFKWSAEQEFIPGSIVENLKALSGLKYGRSKAKETGDVQPVLLEIVEKTLEHLPKIIADLVRLQMLMGCRPGEVVQLKPGRIDRSGEIWLFSPESHKNEHHGHDRTIAIVSEAQDILKPYLLRDADAYCFDPREVIEQRKRNKRLNRKKPLRYEKRKTKTTAKIGGKAVKDHYTTDSYRRAITRACKAADVETWGPNRLRHARATEIRELFGLEGAQLFLGHKSAAITQTYAKLQTSRLIELSKKLG